MAKFQLQLSNISLAIDPLLKRTIVFLIVFILYSGLIGPHIIGSPIYSRGHFTIYGGLGKTALFSTITFILLMRRKDKKLKIQPWRIFSIIWLLMSVIAFGGAWIVVNHSIHETTGLFWPLATHLLLLMVVMLAIVGCFGTTTLRSLARAYKKELLFAIGLGTLFYGLLLLIYSLWAVLAATVLQSTRWLLSVSGLNVTVISSHILVLDKFAIAVTQYCSGVESIAFFTGLYILVGVLDWSRFNRGRYFIVFLPAVISLIGFNILRVYVLILGGYYINAQIAFSLFHTYAGMVFFIIYAGMFWGVSYKWMLQKQNS